MSLPTGEMARHLPDSRDSAEDRAGSRAREASRAAAVRPWTRPDPQATAARSGRRSPSRSSSSSAPSSSCVARGVRAEREGIAPCHAFKARAVGARSAAWYDGRRSHAAGVAGPWWTRRPVSVYGPSPPHDAFGAAATCSAAGPLAAPEGGGAPPRGGAARHTAGPRQAKRAWLASDRGAAWPEGRPRPQGRDAPGLHGA